MKIVFFTQNIGNYISGGRVYAWFIAHALAKAGHQVDIITNYEPLFERDFSNFNGKNNVRIHINREYFIKDKKKLNEVIRPCDLVICAPMTSVDYGVSIGKSFGKAVVGILYEPLNCLEEAASNRIIGIPIISESIANDYTKQLHRCDMILCNTKYGIEKTKEWFPAYKGKLKHLYNSFNTKHLEGVKIKGVDEREDTITFISRTTPYKGYFDIISIFDQHDLSKYTVEFITGFMDKSDEKVKFFKKQCEEKKIKIRFREKITDREKFEILSKTKMLLFPSRFEGFGLPPVEAFMLKTPVVCYDIPTLKEVYENYAHFVDSFDIVGMGNKVNELLNDRISLNRNIDQAYEYVKSFVDNEIYCKKLDEIICSSINKKSQYAFEPKPVEIIKQEPKKEVKRCNIGIIFVGDKPNEEEIVADQKFKNFNIYGCKNINDLNLDEVKEEYLILLTDNIEPSPSMVAEYLIYFGMDNCQLITSNYRLNNEKISIPGFDFNALMVNPHYIPECLGITKTVLKETLKEELDSNWFVDLLVKNRNRNWIHINTCYSFSVESLNNNVKNYRIIKDSLSENIVENFSYKDGVLIPDKSNEKVLMVILARTNKYLPAMLDSIKLSGHSELTCCVCIHAPKGDLDKDVVETCKRNGIFSWIYEGEFNYSKMNNESIVKMEKQLKDESFDYYVLSNDDIVLKQNCIRNLISGFKFNKQAGVVGAKLVYPETEKIQHAGVVLLSDIMCTHKFRKSRKDKLSVSYFKEYDAVTFGLVAISPECYEMIKLDETLPNSFNDVDFCLKAKKKGWDILYNPLAEAIHHETVTREELKIKYDDKGSKIFRDRYQDIFRSKQDYKKMQESIIGCM